MCSSDLISPGQATTTPSFLGLMLPAFLTDQESDLPPAQALEESGYVGVSFGSDNRQLKLATGDTHAAILAPIQTQPPGGGEAELKRRSIATLGLWFLLIPPLADGTISQADRSHIGCLYRGITQPEPYYPPPPPPPPDIGQPLGDADESPAPLTGEVLTDETPTPVTGAPLSAADTTPTPIPGGPIA